MHRALCLCTLLALGFACSKKTIEDGGSSDVDFANPKRVVASVFYAARTGESEHLSQLCDPEGSGNAHVQRICQQTRNGSDWPAFVRQFEKARLIGEPRITGDHAQLNFVFGPSGTTPETMELRRRDGKWYLVAF